MSEPNQPAHTTLGNGQGRTSDPHQAVVDVLGAVNDPEQLVPAALAAVAAAFGADAALFDHPADRIRLLGWLHRGRVYGPGEMYALAPDDRAAVAALTEGFTVPAEYLGTPVNDRARPVLIDHSAGTLRPDFDHLLKTLGTEVELNVPLVFAGRAVGAVSLLRGRDRPFTPAEAALAESLGRQLALAVHAAWLAAEARAAAVARERERAAIERAEELAKANAALGRSVARLTAADDLPAFLDAVLQEAVAAAGAVSGAVFLYDEAADTLTAAAHVLSGRVLNIHTDPAHAPFRDPVPAADDLPWRKIRDTRRPYWVDYRNPEPGDWPQSAPFHRAHGHRVVMAMPMFHGPAPIGFLAVAYDAAVEVRPTESRVELVRVLAQQAALAVHLSRLAAAAEQAAVARERERAAEQRADQLFKANTALRRSVSRLADAADVGAAIVESVRSAAELVDAAGGAVGVYRPDERGFRTLFQVVDGAVVGLGPLGYESRLYSLDEEPIRRAWAAFSAGETVLWCPPDSPYLADDSRAHLAGQGLGSSVLVAINRGASCIGYLGLFSRRTTDIPLGDRELLKAIADQISLMLELSRLAKASEEAAVAREREAAALAQASELARVNDALRDSVAAVARAVNFREGLAEVVLRITRAAAARTAHLFIYDEKTNTLDSAFYTLDGQIHWDRDPTGPAVLQGPFDADITPAFRQMVADRGIYAIDLHTAHDPALGIAWPDIVAWHIARGNRSSCAIPVLAGDRPLGVIGLAWAEPVRFTPEQRGLLLALSNHTGLAIQLARLADEAERVAVARERERAAEERAARAAGATAALQATIDALHAAGDLDQFVPAVLRIVADTFGSPECGFWEHTAGETVYLRYWYTGGRVLDPLALRVPDPALHPVLRRLADGFTVPPAHLHGTAPRDRTRSVVIDHRTAATVPEFHALALSRGWELELNQPLVVGGRADGAITLYRRGDRPFTDQEVELADALAKQLALALQVNVLARQAREVAVARERELAARQRAAELDKANAALRRAVAGFAGTQKIDAFLGYVLAESVSLAEADGGCMSVYDAATGTVRGVAMADGPRLVAFPGRAEYPLAETPVLRRVMADGPVELDLAANVELFWPAVRDALRDKRHARALAFPLAVERELLGLMNLTFRGAHPLGSDARELIGTLATQGALAVLLSRLAERAQTAALLEERSRLARDVHDLLSQSLTGVVLMLEGALAALARGTGSAAGPVEEALGLARTSLAEVRRSIWAFRPAPPDWGGLERALEDLVAQHNRGGAGARVTLGLPPMPPQITPEAEVNLLRIAQEATANAVRHAGATSVHIELTNDNGLVRLSVRDDGRGFDPGAVIGPAFGLTGMRERAARAGGRLIVESTPGRGTRVTALLPAAEPAGS